MTNQPVLNKRDGSLSVSVFKKEKDSKSFHSICVQRSYQKKDSQEWVREQINLFPDDILKLAELLRVSYTSYVELLHKSKAEKSDYPTQALNDSVPF